MNDNPCFRIVSALEKVFPVPELNVPDLESLTVFPGERVHFQTACRSPFRTRFHLEVKGPFADRTSIRTVEYIPCLTPAPQGDAQVITSAPGLFPCALMEGKILPVPDNAWRSFWITLDLGADCPAGDYPVSVEWSADGMETPASPSTLLLHVSGLRPAARGPSCEMWFHGDCLATHYGVKPWSPRYWKLLDSWFHDMAVHGIDTLLTPLWTLPLDTAPGTERPTVQLLEIAHENGRFIFDFRRLKRWISTARRAGLERFAFSHLFTQWGLAATPKIMVCENGREVRMFGWDVPSDSPLYTAFLKDLFEALLPFLRENGLTKDLCSFHLSDEPERAHLEKYRRASELVHSMIGEYSTSDALSDLAFYDLGLTDVPVPSTDVIEPFLERKIANRWVYYCGNWRDGVPNRKFGMTSQRNRILGVLMYLHDIRGFLEWGYNFYYSMFSLEQNLDPWNFADLPRIFGADGGAFAVLPGRDGRPVPTLYYEVFSDALQDYRILRALEASAGRDAVLSLVCEGLEKIPTFHAYPRDPSWLFGLRNRIAEAAQKMRI